MHELKTTERFVALPKGLKTTNCRTLQFTHWDTAVMIREGILPDDGSVELMDGMIVLNDQAAVDEDPTAIGKHHNYVVRSLAELATGINGESRNLRSQSTLICSDTYVPVPDAVVLKGPRTNQRDYLPTAAEALCVVEVADGSYERDAKEKLAGYARAGVAQYVIINLRNRTAEM